MEYFTNYIKHTQNDKHFKTSFELSNCPLYVANSLRRSFSSNIPTVTFSDTYYENPQDRSINIKINTSALHNEFLSHRISLIPINMELPDTFLINTKQNKKGNREYYFDDATKVPIFTLNIKNTTDQEINRDKYGLIDVTTHDFTTDIDEYTIDQFFLNDVFTNKPILINKLKYNISNPDDGDELNIICKPTIGQGKLNARYDPTGTVTFNYKVDNTNIEDVLQKKIIYLTNERISKGLEKFTETELLQIRKSFNLLDKERVFHKDGFGNPNIFEFSIESIGFLNPDQIIFDGITMLYLQVKDIINSVDLSFIDSISKIDEDTITFSNNDKLSIQDIENSDNLGIDINIKNENHTIGNLISSCIRSHYCGENALEKNLLSISSYKMQHPTIEEIDIVMVPDINITKEEYIGYIYNLIDTDELFINKLDLSENLFKKDIIFIRKLLCTMLFVKSMFIVSTTLNNILKNFKEISQINHSIINIKDQPNFYTKNSWCTNKISPDFTLDLLSSTKPEFI